MIWDLNWNRLTAEEKAGLQEAAECCTCHCTDHRQVAVEMFAAAVEVIKARDRREVEATMRPAPAPGDA